MKKTVCSFLCFLIAMQLYCQKFEGLALTPPMGWNSWNKFGGSINEDIVKQIADAIVLNGLDKLGYNYVILDDHWHGERDSDGNIQPNPERFPSGMKALGDYLHAKGLKFGIYSDAGTMTCGLCPGSKGYEYQDARTYAEWGVDYLKYDWCHTEGLDQKTAYTLMRDALYAAGRPVLFNICEWGTSKPWEWGKAVGHLWRTGSDIWNCFDCEHQGESLSIGVMQILDKQDPKYRQYGGPDGWNDPDMMQVGNGMTDNENRAHFSMWVMLASPLILGNDLRNMTNETLETISNKEAIAINQDPLGVRGLKYTANNNLEVWFKPLDEGDWAVCFLNRSTSPQVVNIDWNNYIFTDDVSARSTGFDKTTYQIRNVWAHENEGNTSSQLSKSIPGRDVLMFRLYKSNIPEEFEPSQTIKGSGTAVDPYQIETPQHLYNVRGYINNPDVHFKLMNDIDLADFLASFSNGWTSIGTDFDNAFTGTFDGNGKIIRNLNLTTQNNNNGLFGCTKSPAEIKNLTIENANFKVGGWSGILVGMNGNWEYAGGRILNCHIVNGSIEGEKCIGGLIGVNAGIVENSSAMNIKVTGSDMFIGGLIGENNSDDNTLYLRNCSASGVVAGDGESIGGLIGLNRIIFVENCVSFCDVYGGTNCGGIIGYNNGGAAVNNCFAYGNIEGKSAGGIVGAPQTAELSNCYFMGNVLGFTGQDVFSGGLNGAAYDCKFTNCYFNGTLDGTARDRALTGRAIRINFTNCYFNSTLAGCETGYQDNEDSQGTVTALTDDKMKTGANFSGLLASGKWQIWEGISFPFLANQSHPVIITSANTAEIKGECNNDNLSELLFYSYSDEDGLVQLYPSSYNLGRSWEAVFPANQLTVDMEVFVIAKETGNLFSYPVSCIVDKAPVGLDNGFIKESNMMLYPNPAQDEVYISAKNGSEVFSVSIYDALGKTMLEKENQQNHLAIALTDFDRGIYIVKIKTATEEKTEKLIIK